MKGFGSVAVPVTKPENREEMIIQASMLREVLTSEICKIKNGEKDYSPHELKQLVDAINMNNDITLKAMGDHKDSKPLEYTPEEMKNAELGNDSILESGLKDILKKMKKNKNSIEVETINEKFEDI